MDEPGRNSGVLARPCVRGQAPRAAAEHRYVQGAPLRAGTDWRAGRKICRCPCAGKRQRTASPERVPIRKRGLRADGRPHPPALSGETPAMSPAGSGARRFPDSSPARGDGCPNIAPARSARKRRKICRSTAPPPPRRDASSGTARPRER